MAQMIMDSFREFTGGVVTAGLAARQSRSTSPKGWNSILVNVGRQSATPAKRPGCKTVNTDAIDTEAVMAQIEYLRYASGVPTRLHIVILASGEIGSIASDSSSGDGAWTQISSDAFATAEGADVAHTVAKNLLFIVDGSAKKKLRGTALENFGIVRPDSAPSAASGAAGGMTGTFEVRYTFENGNTNHESSASDTSSEVSLTSQKLSLSDVDVSSDSQVTKRNIYIRETGSQVSFRLAGSIDDNTTTTAVIDIDHTTLTVLGPNTTQNDPPPAGITATAWWKSYMIVADDQNIYWSQRDKPEAFFVDDFEPVGGLDGQKITALVPYGEALLIFKDRSVHALTGRTPASWQLKPLFTDIGCVSRRSIVNAGGVLGWWSHKGPMIWDGTGYPLPIGELLLGSDLTWNKARVTQIQGADDEVNQLMLWTYPSETATENDLIIPFGYNKLFSAWHSNKWDPMNVASLGTMQDSTGRRWVYFGNYNGQLFRFDDALADGVPSGTVTGTFTASGTSVSSISGTGFYATDSGLTGRMVTVEDENGVLMGRMAISSNTSTALTLEDDITGLTDGETYTYYIGGPNFEWATPPEDSDQSFIQKRYKTLHIKTANEGGTVGVDFFTDNNGDTAKRSLSFLDDHAEKSNIPKRLVASGVGLEWQAIVRQRAANQPVTLYDIAMTSQVLTEKIG